MQYIESVAELIGALTTIIGALIAVNKLLKGKLIQWLQKPVLDGLEKLEKKHDENMVQVNKRIDKIELEDLKQNIMNEKLPITERLNCGDRYIELGGNGAIKVYVHELKEEYEKVLKEEGML